MPPVRYSPTRDPATEALLAQRVADLSTFASGMVHDLRNPLNVIRTNLYLLRKWVPADEPRAVRALERVDDQVGVAMRLLEGAQAFYRAERATLQPTQLNEIVQNVADTTSLPEGYFLETDLAVDLPTISAEAQLLDSILRALIRNAVEALSGGGGTIRVRTEGVDGTVRLSVADNGEGISPEVGDRIFEPFFTTRRSHSGLGLATVSRVVSAHGGTVYAESEPGEGTRVVTDLPAARPLG